MMAGGLANLSRCSRSGASLAPRCTFSLKSMVHLKGRTEYASRKALERGLSTATSRRAEAFHTQLENPATAAFLTGQAQTPQTLTEKIVQRYAVGLPEGKLVKAGDFISISPHRCMTHDNSWPVILRYMTMGATELHDSSQLVIALDHDVQNKSESNLRKYAQIEKFAKTHGIVDFHPAGRGIGHQIMVEEGYSWPGTLSVASDSHSNSYGAVGSLGTPIVRADAASVYAIGRTWWQIPPVARINLTGTLPANVTGKDVIIALCGLFDKDEVLNHAIEFTGSEETMASLSIDNRFTIANMTTEHGALTGLFPIDRTLELWLRDKADKARQTETRTTRQRINHQRIDELFRDRLSADRDAVYAKQLYLNLSTLSPHVSGPDSVKIITPVHEITQRKIKIDRAYVVSCTNSRASDLAAAAKVFRDAAETNSGAIPRVDDGVKFYISAASSVEQEAAEAAGDWQVLIEAGATPLITGCGPCIGMGEGLLKPAEVGISASNRNFKSRMGSREAQAYLASPQVVAASALNGYISGPTAGEVPAAQSGVDFGFGTGEPRTTENEHGDLVQQMDSLVERYESALNTTETAVTILPGFPERISGEIVFCDRDAVNTDGIYPGNMTYKDDVTKEEMAAACMKNYDPEFKDIARPNDILVAGFGFGIGSSREQAATAILAKGIPLVIASSFSNIFLRNSINNALMGLEVPRLVERLRAHFTERKLTRRTGWTLTWDVGRCVVEVQEGPEGEKWTERVSELPTEIQKIIAAGGIEGWVRAEIAKTGDK